MTREEASRKGGLKARNQAEAGRLGGLAGDGEEKAARMREGKVKKRAELERERDEAREVARIILKAAENPAFTAKLVELMPWLKGEADEAKA